MKRALIVAAVFAAMTAQARAENWSAVGILTTHNKQLDYFKTEFVKIDGFKSHDDCYKAVKFESGSSDYIGLGGTNKRVPEVQWNYDADCMKINDE